ncbi:MAG: Fic family protein [Treponema sp.]|uniref:Fic family protein n=1 Tax=Treponema sp. TaxID=166 RepID=UPI00298DDB31|nr:Fic family protein [Treponema sp.]MCQ2601834.1 Fic family protein [Treponema sp.]
MPREQNPFEIDFDTYILQSEPSKQEKGKLWQTAIGLQRVDGLTPSKYLYETAKRNIDGEITIEEAKKLIDSYYESKIGREEINEDEKEADQVSVRIREILAENTFSFTPDLLLSIHKRLFTGVFYKVKAGSFRDYNISKKEWVLDGESVLYANADMIRQTLDYDFTQEKAFNYSTLSTDEKVKHLARFIANIWQIHPFGEGNTRTTAVFTIKYLNSLGFKVNNEPFEKNSWYFRNSLVRANYTNMTKGIYMNTEYLEKFFRNLLLGESNELKNRYVHMRAQNLPVNEQKNENTDKILPVNLPVNKTQRQLLELLLDNPRLTYDELAEKMDKTRETIRTNLRTLEKMHLIQRIGADKNGHWKILLKEE